MGRGALAGAALVVAVGALGGATIASAQGPTSLPFAPLQGPGDVEVGVAYPGTIRAAHQSGIPLTVVAQSRPRRGHATRTGRITVTRGPAGRRCAASPGRDRGAVVARGTTRPGTGTQAMATVIGTATFPAGTTRLCVWVADPGRGYGRPTAVDRTFAAALFAGGHTLAPDDETPDSSEWSTDVASTHRFRQEAHRLRGGINGTCSAADPDVDERTTQDPPPRTISGGWFRNDAGCMGGRTVATVLDGPLAGRTMELAEPRPPASAPAVVSHFGDCMPSAAMVFGYTPPEEVRQLLPGLGCAVGRTIFRPNPNRREGEPPSGRVYRLAVGGLESVLAPPGTPIDLLVDTAAPAAVGPPSGPVDTAPQPGDGYDGPPPATPGCQTEVKAGPIVALASCWRVSGEQARATGRVRLNGLDLTPTGSRGAVVVNTRTFRIHGEGPVELRVGSIALLRGALDWRRPDAVFELEGEARAKDGKPAFTTRRQKLYDLPVGGSARAELKDGRTVLTVSVSVPDEPALKALDRFAGASGELSAAATNEAGLVLDEAKIVFPGFRLGFVEVQDAEVAVSLADTNAYHFDGKATIFPFRFARMGFTGELGFGPRDGYFKAALAAEQLNRSLVYGFFLQKIGAGFQVNPFGLTGSAGVTFGPQFRLGGDLISAARLDGSVSYLSGGASSDPSALELAGALEVAEAKAADGKVALKGTTVTAEGTLALKVAGYGLEGRMDGWFDGMRAFNVEGGASIKLPGPDAGGDAVLSSVGAAACRRGFGPDVGFGYTWGEGVGGISFMASSCGLGPWRASASAAQAAGGVRTVRVRRGQPRLAVQVQGAGGPPRVAFVAPDGRRIEPSAAPDGEVVDDRTLYVEDPDTQAAYLAVDRPAPGAWRIEPLGGAPVSGVRAAQPLPRLAISARVRGRGARRTVTYRLRGLAGRRVQFVQTVAGRRQVVGTARRARGRVRFTLAPGSGRRTIVALPTLDGLPDGTARTVARFRGTARPATPRRVRVRRTRTGRVVSWRGSRDLRYEVDARLSDGRRIRRIARAGTRSVTIGLVPRSVRDRVTVVARDAQGVASRSARKRG